VMKKGFKVKLTKEQIEEFLKWEHDHQMKLFPWMEEEDENAGQAIRNVQPERKSAGRNAQPDESF
jgi:hypothetical protein